MNFVKLCRRLGLPQCLSWVRLKTFTHCQIMTARRDQIWKRIFAKRYFNM